MDARPCKLTQIKNIVPFCTDDHDSDRSPQAIQEATASEPLSIDQEFAMQESWRKDVDKLTFIICHPLPHLDPNQQQALKRIRAGTYDGANHMIGDVNLFLSTIDNPDVEVDDHTGRSSLSNLTLNGELELMIPSPEHQRKGYGRAALLTFMRFVLTHQENIVSEYLSSHPFHGSANHVSTHSTTTPTRSSSSSSNMTVAETKITTIDLILTAKISSTNHASLALFQSLGFEKTSPPNYFGEYDLTLPRSLALSLKLQMRDEGGSGSLVEGLGYREVGYGYGHGTGLEG